MCYDNKEMRDLMKSVREITTYKWIIKKSEFICTLIPCNDETAVDNIIKEYQEKYQFTWTGLLGLISLVPKNVPMITGNRAELPAYQC